ncbi:MAG: methionine adenosyltransferase [Clostridia bacterium]|nr:methionine adenosyltransferase [Clostridia bacterium]MBR3152213.1 methionine adenosyltransferase [Clostridia bacterium]MBR3152250.1 methionine adenosyltransferase [Clostridia bacterium]
MRKLFTSESVTEGHPDKLCDYISDSVLDSFFAEDENSRVACETVAGKGVVFITGEISSNANVDIEKVARNAIKEVGYFGENYDIDYNTCKIVVNVSKQSPDIAQGVDNSLEDKEGEAVNSEGAGDQGLMFGFACDETEELMPLPISLAHKLSKKLTDVRKEGIIDYIGADGKVQVTVEYEDSNPVRIDTIVVSVQHREDVSLDQLKRDIKEKVIKEVVPPELLDDNTRFFINPTGRFVIGGPLGDSGLTGRKIIVDTYGGYSRHGGGAFSGKDPTKVDRSAAYMARHVAKNVVANGYAKRCEIQFAYSIGVAKPVSIYIDTFGTNSIPESEILDKINKKFDLTPRGIINYLELRKPIYRKTTNYGHFGREGLPWEEVIEL